MTRPVFVNIGERTNVTGSAKFKKLVSDGRLFTAPWWSRANRLRPAPRFSM